MAHFAVDDQEVRFCTELKGKASWFLPFNKGRDGGAGNPVNPDGLMTRIPVERDALQGGSDRHTRELRPTHPDNRPKDWKEAQDPDLASLSPA